MPRFTIIAIHYQGVIDEPSAIRSLSSIAAQTCRDYELLVYHDGPLHRPWESDKVIFPPGPQVRYIETAQRYNDWGHSLRDMGIWEASGDYLLFFNMDNVLYPQALERIGQTIDQKMRGVAFNGVNRTAPDIVIFPIWLMGCVGCGRKFLRLKEHAHEFRLPMMGFPTMHRNIDCMQFVMRRDLWRAEGGWKDKSEESDGMMYEAFAAKYGTRYVGEMLGEHW